MFVFVLSIMNVLQNLIY